MRRQTRRALALAAALTLAVPAAAQTALEQMLGMPGSGPATLPPGMTPPGGAPSQAPASAPAAKPAPAAREAKLAKPVAVAVPPRPAVRPGLTVPKGSRVALPVVEGFVESEFMIGLVNESADAAIAIADMPSMPADQVEGIVNRTLRLQPGVRIEKSETLARTDGTRWPLVTARRVAGGNVYTLLGTGFALPESLAIVTISLRRDGPLGEAAARDLLLQAVPALDGEVTVPDQLLAFRLNPPPPLRYATVSPPTTAVFTIGSVARPGNPRQPVFVVGLARQPPPPENVPPAEIARAVLAQIGAIDKVNVRSTGTARLGGYPATETIADAVDRTDGGARRVIQWLATVPGGQLLAYGIAIPEQADSAFAAFRAGAATIAVK
jgi:hypothetical protein